MSKSRIENSQGPASSVQSEFNKALVLHQLGKLTEAERAYRAILKSYHRHFDAAQDLEPKLVPLRGELKRVNETLWQIEDDIRAKEAARVFDQDFIALARAVYHNNDRRGVLKQQINALLKSGIVEEKQYSRY